MAAGLGFKTFTTGEVLTAADVNGYLMQGILVFASAAARDAAITAPQEGQFAFLKDTNVTTYYTGSAWANVDTTGMTNPMTTTGDTIYSSSGSTPARLGIGTAGQVLTVNSGATAPEWKTPATGGKVLQVVNATTATSATNTTTTYADTNLTATITPTLNTSKVLIILSQDMNKAAGTNAMNVKLLRGATNLLAAQAVEQGIYTVYSGNHLELYSHSYGITYLDSPATTSATTYKTQFAIRAGGTGTVFAQGQGSYSTITLMEIGA